MADRAMTGLALNAQLAQFGIREAKPICHRTGLALAIDKHAGLAERDADMVAATFRNLTAPTKVKEAKTVCKKAGIKQSQSTFEKVTRLENYLKTSLSIQDGAPFAGVSDVLKNKSGSELGVMCVYTSLLAYLGVPLEVVATSTPYNSKLDPEFPSYDALTDFMPSRSQFPPRLWNSRPVPSHPGRPWKTPASSPCDPRKTRCVSRPE